MGNKKCPVINWYTGQETLSTAIRNGVIYSIMDIRSKCNEEPINISFEINCSLADYRIIYV